MHTIRCGVRSRQRGVTLIFVLITIAIISVISAGVGSLIVAHYGRATTDRDAARAIDIAECAAEYQVQRIYANLNTTAAPLAYSASVNDASNTTSIESATYGLPALALPIATKTYNSTTLNAYLALNTGAATPDYATCWIKYATDNAGTRHLDVASGNPTEDIWVYGQARVNGVVRTVRATLIASGLYNYNLNKMAIFGASQVKIKGSMDVPQGTIGSNGTIDVQKPGSIGGQVVYGTGTPSSNLPYSYGGPTMEIPTIDTVATVAYAAGGYPNTGNTGMSKFIGATSTATNNDNRAYATDGSGNPITATGAFTLKNNTLNLRSKSTGTNFYITGGFGGPNVTIYADVSQGPINLWIDATGTDSVNGGAVIVAYTNSTDKAAPVLANALKFNIYYRNPSGTVTINGGSTFYAMFYAYNKDNAGNAYGTVDLNGNGTLNGSIYGNIVGPNPGANGNFTVNYPYATSNTSNLYEDYYFIGLKNAWHEFNPVQGN